MIAHAALWLFASTITVLAAVARARSAAVSYARPTVVTLLAGALAVIVIGDERGSPMSLGMAPAMACAIVCAAGDLATGLIFDSVTASAALMILLTALAVGSVPATAVGACVCAGSLLALYALTRGRGIGLGDVKLGAVIGAGCGGAGAIGAIGTAFVAGALWAVPLLVRKRVHPGDRVVFAPFLALGTIASLGMRLLSAHG
jgi:prepilin signal peptidase PulO-like enzyme (type II secretory pathway)